MNSLIFNNFQVGYNQQPIFQEFSATLETGKLYAILGKNGVGKSTFIKSVCGLIPALAGTVSFSDVNLTKAIPAVRSKLVSIVLTGRTYVPELTGRELVALGRNPHKTWTRLHSTADELIVEQTLQICGCADLADQNANSLSDGQFQLIMIARTVAQKTPILLLDEPTTHLDPAKKADLLQLLKNLAEKEQKIVLFTTHDIDFVLDVIDEVLLCDQDQINLKTLDELHEGGDLSRIFNSDFLRYDDTFKKFRFENR